jgi:potassium efflux system protein
MGLSTLVPGGQDARDFALYAVDLARDWLQSPAAWSQLALLVLAYAAAAVAVRRLAPALGRWLAPPADQTGPLAQIRRFVLVFLPLLAYALTAMGETITRTMFDSGAIIAFGKRVFLLVAARILVRDILRGPLPRAMGRFVVLPVAGLYVLGLLLPLATVLENTTVPLGNLSFNLLWLLQFLVVGTGLFWLGRWSNSQSAQFPQTQDQLRPATRQLAEKAAEVAIFGAAFLIAMNIMGVSLTSLAVLGGAVGVGPGFGLQKIASNFISGVILLLEGQTTVGDYVELDGGQAGTIVKMTARAAILETFDGKGGGGGAQRRFHRHPGGKLF